MDCPACGADAVRRLTETDLVCGFCGHDWVEAPEEESFALLEADEGSLDEGNYQERED